jgi:hypothetical protein
LGSWRCASPTLPPRIRFVCDEDAPRPPCAPCCLHAALLTISIDRLSLLVAGLGGMHRAPRFPYAGFAPSRAEPRTRTHSRRLEDGLGVCAFRMMVSSLCLVPARGKGKGCPRPVRVRVRHPDRHRHRPPPSCAPPPVEGSRRRRPPPAASRPPPAVADADADAYADADAARRRCRCRCRLPLSPCRRAAVAPVGCGVYIKKRPRSPASMPASQMHPYSIFVDRDRGVQCAQDIGHSVL